MKHTHNDTPTRHRPSRVLLITAAITAVVVAGVGIYGLLHAPNHDPSEPPTPAPATSLPMPSGKPSVSPTDMTDAEAFARWAATTLFTWDTATMNPADITDKLMAMADPTGDGEAPGLASDITNYLPDQGTWATLRSYATTQRLDIQTLAIPEGWEQVKASAVVGQLLPGTVAYTITGTRHRDGIWNDQPTSFSAPVTFTMFITCQPSFPECHLMRLSLPDQPLE